ncbi:cytoplasmic dynein 1 light intermediate chain 2 isoform X3 [Cloeon dipterum]|uniref:cytoplasmic dynein 1 light intermediate chain 2 isoform X3 n=1 Tax=Cloeon dipterum TaxID=197152 RepID=UPI0032209E69
MMAPISEKISDTGVTPKNKDEPDNKENLWAAILSEVQSRGNTKLPTTKSVLVLGENESGKTTLIAKLQGVEDPKKGSGLEYAYIDVRDEYRDDNTRLRVWVLDGDPEHSHLLEFALNEETFPDTMIMFSVSMTSPWAMLDQLQNWATILQDHIDKLNLSADFIQERKQSVLKRWQEYMEPGDELEASSPMRHSTRTLEDDLLDEELPLGEGTLTRNLGLDMVVVVTKTDYMGTLEKDMDYRDEHFDFIQQWIRRFCLQYGAALFYTSVKEDKNCDLLYKYLVHRIYHLPFRTPALVVEKDAVLIPSGWDNMKKISILYENMQSMKPDDYYTDVISRPQTRKPITRETEIHAEDEQQFLIKQQQLLQQGGTPSAPLGMTRQESPMRTPTSSKTSDRRTSATPGSQGSPKKMQMDGAKVGAAAGGEGVLANFFNSLLHKKTGSPSPGKVQGMDKAAVRSDAAAELDRLTRNKKPPSPTGSPDSSANSSLEQPPSSTDC